VWQAIRHHDVLILTALHFVQNGSAYALAFWLPTMLKRLSGLGDFKALAHRNSALGDGSCVTGAKRGELGNLTFSFPV